MRPPTIGHPTSRTTSTQRAWVSRPKGKHTTVTEDRGRVYRDRGRVETRTLVIDRKRKWQRERWTHAESGEEYVKDVSLSGDPELHGPASSSLFRRRDYKTSIPKTTAAAIKPKPMRISRSR